MSLNTKIEQDTSDLLVAGMNRLLNPGSTLTHRFKSDIINMADQQNARDLNTKVVQYALSRNVYYQTLTKYRRNWVVEAIYDTLSNDILLDNTSNDTIKIEIDGREDLAEEAEKLFQKLNIIEILNSILDDLIHYGSYSLRPLVYPKRGVVDLIDDYEPYQVLALTDSKNIPVMYFVSDDYLSGQLYNQEEVDSYYSNYQNKRKIKYHYKSTSELLYFGLDLSFTKIYLDSEETEGVKDSAPVSSFKSNLPKTLKIRTSRSFIFNVIDKLQDILMMDKLNTMKSIGDTLTPTVLGIPLPDNYDADQSINIVNRYDSLLNSNIDNMSDFTFSNYSAMFRELSRIKVVPVVGERSSPTQLDTRQKEILSNTENELTALKNLLNSLGIPVEIFFGEEEHKTVLKNNIRYAKKVKRIQKNISRTLSRLLMIHFRNKYDDYMLKDLNESDIKITLRNNTNIDEMEDLESQDLTVSSLNSSIEILNSIEDLIANSDYEIDNNVIIEVFKERLSNSGSAFAQAIKLSSDKENKDKKDIDFSLMDDSGVSLTPTSDDDSTNLEDSDEDVGQDSEEV